MPKVQLGSRMSHYPDLQVEGFRNVFTISKIFIHKFQVTRYAVFDKQTWVFFVEGKSIIQAVNKLLIFLADKEQEDIDFFIKVSK